MELFVIIRFGADFNHMSSALSLLETAKIIFWDFDGVIKESVPAKADAFEQLFLFKGPDFAKKVRVHHEKNGGVSRYNKIPLYLSWAHIEATPERIQEYIDKFANLALESVINSPWVPGVREYIEQQAGKQKFILVTATPQEEIKTILSRLNILRHFPHVMGYPTTKSSAIKQILDQYSASSRESIMVGDSVEDLNAALDNNVPFLLKVTEYNKHVRSLHAGTTFETLSNE